MISKLNDFVQKRFKKLTNRWRKSSLDAFFYIAGSDIFGLETKIQNRWE
jgi:hypothetical protein